MRYVEMTSFEASSRRAEVCRSGRRVFHVDTVIAYIYIMYVSKHRCNSLVSRKPALNCSRAPPGGGSYF